MKLGNYNLDTERIDKELSKNPRVILLQLPDGLKMYSERIVSYINSFYEERNLEKPLIYIWLDTAFGSCDLPLREAKELGVELLIHIGHHVFVNTFYP